MILYNFERLSNAKLILPTHAVKWKGGHTSEDTAAADEHCAINLLWPKCDDFQILKKMVCWQFSL